MIIRYRARKKTAGHAVICFLLLAAAAAAAYAARRFGVPALYLASFSLFMFFFQIFSVFIVSAYEYELDGDYLRIFRVAGKRSVRVFDADLRLASALLTWKQLKASDKEKRMKRLICLCGVSKKRASALVCRDTVLLFAPDEAFAAAVRERLS